MIVLNQSEVVYKIMMNKFSNILGSGLRFSLAQVNSRAPFLKISSTALERLKQIMQQRRQQKLVGLKISLTKKGCSGLAYSMDYIREQQIKKYDQVVEQQGIKVVVDSKAVMALVGTQMNYVQDELGSQFVFNNPNQKGRCGCGTSFHL